MEAHKKFCGVFPDGVLPGNRNLAIAIHSLAKKADAIFDRCAGCNAQRARTIGSDRELVGIPRGFIARYVDCAMGSRTRAHPTVLAVDCCASRDVQRTRTRRSNHHDVGIERGLGTGYVDYANGILINADPSVLAADRRLVLDVQGTGAAVADIQHVGIRPGRIRAGHRDRPIAARSKAEIGARVVNLASAQDVQAASACISNNEVTTNRPRWQWRWRNKG
ncbi:hypothetical protein D3C87_1517700 [compost metagenome]